MRSSDVKATTAEGRTMTNTVHSASDDARRERKPAMEPSEPNQPTNDDAAQSNVMVEEKGTRRGKKGAQAGRMARDHDRKGRRPFAEEIDRHRDELPPLRFCAYVSVFCLPLVIFLMKGSYN